MLKQIMEERRASSIVYDDMLYHLLDSKDSKYNLSDEEIIDQIITILYSGYETVSTTSMMAIKYLHDHPKALQELRVSDSFACLNSYCILNYGFDDSGMFLLA